MPLENPVFLLYSSLGILGQKAVPAESGTGFAVETSLSLLRLGGEVTLALIPGVSRSGGTISAGLFLNLDREVLKSGKPVLNRITEYPADKSFRLMESNVWPLKNARGRVIGTARAYRVISAAESKTDRYGRMREVAAFIAENYATKLQLADLAAMAGMSESRFKHVFAKTFAATPGRYITTIRLNAARRLLEETDDLLSDIATATGFFDQSHMTRAFKAMRDLTPGEYRRRHRAQTEA